MVNMGGAKETVLKPLQSNQNNMLRLMYKINNP